MKRKNKSRLTRTDVNTICQMQFKIDTYETYIITMFSHALSFFKNKPPFNALMKGTDMDDWVNVGVRKIDEMKDLLCLYKKYCTLPPEEEEAIRRKYHHE